MESTNNVKCPQCSYSFDVSEILTQRIKENYEKNYLKKFEEIEKLKSEILKQQNRIQEEIETGINLKIKAEKLILEKRIRVQIETENSEQLKSYKEQLDTQIQKTKELLKLKAEHQKIQREMESLKEQYEAEMQEKLSKSITEVRTQLKADIQKSVGLKITEKDILIEQLKTEIANAQRRIDQSSQQLQGESAEIYIEKYLKENFLNDEVSEYKKGERGADCILIVKSNSSEIAGRIVFESKRTKTFQKDWIDKFREDMRKKNATFGVLITDVYPKGINKMTQIKEVWVCSFTEFQNLCFVLREAVLLLYQAQSSQKNKGSKMELLYAYLTGSEFRNSIESIVEGFTCIKEDLEKEKRAIQGLWKSREKQLQRVLLNTSELYHSVRGLVGKGIPPIKQLDLPGDKKLLS